MQVEPKSSAASARTEHAARQACHELGTYYGIENTFGGDRRSNHESAATGIFRRRRRSDEDHIESTTMHRGGSRGAAPTCSPCSKWQDTRRDDDMEEVYLIAPCFSRLGDKTCDIFTEKQKCTELADLKTRELFVSVVNAWRNTNFYVLYGQFDPYNQGLHQWSTDVSIPAGNVSIYHMELYAHDDWEYQKPVTNKAELFRSASVPEPPPSAPPTTEVRYGHQLVQDAAIKLVPTGHATTTPPRLQGEKAGR